MRQDVARITAPSLEGNLLGDPVQQYIQVFLPPSYDFSDLRYPVIYFLPGFGGSPNGDNEFFSPVDLAQRMVDGSLPESILVIPNGANRVGGSFYVNSPVIGDWENFIVQDVVGYVDANYRTIAEAGGRGIGGHSMGGFGAFNLAMRHPDLFGAAYSLSGGLLAREGLADFHVLNPEKRVENFLEIIQEIQELPEPEALAAMGRYDGPNALALAYGVAFAPNPEMGPPFMDYPYQLKDGVVVKDRAAWERWESGIGELDEKVIENRENLLALRGILIDYARQDHLEWIPRGSEHLAQVLSAAGVENELLSFDGGHADKIEERIIEVMLPFFSRVLEKAR
jgi:S-formylglutathione hydrolase FrmB